MHTSDITIHINQTTGPEQQQDLENKLRDIDGVIAPRFNLPHLLVVLFDAEKTSARMLLDKVKGQGYQAQLIGL